MSFLLSVLVPVFNDQDVISELYIRLKKVFTDFYPNHEILFVDDGSSDLSWEKIENLITNDDTVIGIKLLRNFGQQNAIAAGLDYLSGDIIVLMDSDLQDKPEDIPKLINALIEGDYSMAIAKWKTRKDKWTKKILSGIFFSVTSRITKIKHQPNLGVFRAIRKNVINELSKYKEKTSTTLSLLYWIGIDYVAVELERDARFAGSSGYNLSKMLKLTFDRIFSFSMFPIRAAIYSGLTISLFSFIFGLILIVRRFLGHISPGWTSTIVIILFLFGLNFLFLGVIGEYLGRVFLEAKQRPKYVIKKIVGKLCKK